MKFNGDWGLGIGDDDKIKLEKILLNENLKELISSLDLQYAYENNNDEEIKNKIIDELSFFKYPHLIKDFDIHSNFEFCSELKQFYVIVTRPRTFLLFYEERANENFSFFNRMINNRIIEKPTSNIHYVDTIMNFYKSKSMLIDNRTKMKLKGDAAFEEGKFFDAAYFYSKSGEEILEKKSKIYYNYNILLDEKKNGKNNLSPNEIETMAYEVLNYIKDLKIKKKYLRICMKLKHFVIYV